MSETTWEVVGASKQQKTIQKKAKKEEEKAIKKKEEEKQRAQREKEVKEFYNQYISSVPTNSFYDVLSVLGTDNKFTKKKKEEKQKKEQKEKQFTEDSEDRYNVNFAEAKAKERTKKKNISAKKPKTDDVKITMEQAASRLDTESLKTLFQQYAENYPEKYDLQLTRLAEHFEVVFNPTKNEMLEREAEPLMERLEFPMNQLEEDTVAALREWFNTLPEDSVAIFFWVILETLLNSITKTDQKFKLPTSGLGIKILLQFCASYYPQVFYRNLPQIRNQYSKSPTYLFSPQVAPIFIWLFAQPLLQQEYQLALSLWLHFLLPIAASASFDKEIQKLTFELFNKIQEEKDETYPDESSAIFTINFLIHFRNTDKKTNSEFQKILPIISKTSFLFAPSNFGSKKHFTTLLSHAAIANQALRDEILSELLTILEKNPSITRIWKEVYPKYIAQSNNLLLYVNFRNQKKNLPSNISPNLIIDLANSFIQENNKILQNSSKTEEKVQLNRCNETCKLLIRNLRNSGTNLVFLIPASIAAIGGALFLYQNCCSMEWCLQTKLMHC